jgi:hypothetical protein
MLLSNMAYVVAAYTGGRFFASSYGCSFVPDCWYCAQKLHQFLIVNCVCSRLYVEKEQKSSLVLNRWCFAK